MYTAAVRSALDIGVVVAFDQLHLSLPARP
jgi:hypothetical protein